MAIQELLCSGPGTGKTSYCIDLFTKTALRSKAGLDSRSYFILPNREHAERIQNLILKKEVVGLFNAHILTIKDLTSLLLGPAAARHPDDGLRMSILTSILEDPSRDWKYFESVKNFFGFKRLLADTIKELSAGLVTLDEMEERAQPLLKDAVFRDKFRDFSVVYKQYLTKLEELGLNEIDENIEKLPPMDLVIFDGFYHFTNTQRQLIEAVCRASRHVAVTLTMPDDADTRPFLFHYPGQTRRLLIKAGFSEKKGGLRKNQRCSDASLLHLQNELFRSEPKTGEGVKNSLLIMEAPSIRTEAEMIAREIKRLYREKAFHYSDMCVILRTVTGYEEVLGQVFSDFGIPMAVHERKKLIENGFTATLWRFLELIREDWRREDVFFVLRSSYLAGQVSREAVRALEGYAFSKNLRAGRSEWLRASEDAALPESARGILLKLIEWENAVRSSASSARAFRIISRWVGQFAQEHSDEMNGLVFQALERLLEAKFSSADEEEAFNPVDLAKRLQESLDAALFSVKAETKNRVQIYDVIMALPKEYKAVFLAGLAQDVFPKDAGEDALFKDDERRVMNKKGTVLEERAWRAAGEHYFFYMACARAKEKLYLSYPLFDADSRPKLASFFVEEVKKCFDRDIPVRRKALDEWVPEPAEWESQWDVVRTASHAFREASSSSGMGKFLKQDDAWRRVVAGQLRDEKARLTDPRILKLFLEDKELLSATKLELYATCAFKYFSERVLKLGDTTEGLEFRIMGTILHKSLERFYKKMAPDERRDPAVWKDLKPLRQKLLAELEAAWEEETALSYEPVYRRQLYRTETRRYLERFIAREAAAIGKRNMVPMHFELNFGPLRIASEPRDILIKGQIDRIDLDRNDPTKAIIVDYKRSEKKLSKKIENEMEYQLPVYILAAKDIFGLDVQGAELQPLKKGSTEGLYRETARASLGLGRKQALSEEEWNAFLDESRERIRALVKRMREGDISVDSKSCEYCDQNTVCRFEKKELPFLQYEKRKNKNS